MSDLLERIRAAQVTAAEDAVIASIPPDMKAMLDNAQARHKANGGCPGCGSMVFAVHRTGCPNLAGDVY